MRLDKNRIIEKIGFISIDQFWGFFSHFSCLTNFCSNRAEKNEKISSEPRGFDSKQTSFPICWLTKVWPQR